MTTNAWTAAPTARTDPSYVAAERPMLEEWLDFHRDTLLQKCAGLDAEQLKARTVEPSALSLLGLVRHMVEVERWWFRTCFAGEPLEDVYCTPDNRDADFDDVATADAEADLTTYRGEVVLARAACAGRDLDEVCHDPRNGREINLRWIYVHMIEEYARHNGHADLLRERIDGLTGD